MEKIIKTGLMAYGMSGKIFHAPFVKLHPGFHLSAIVERTKNEAVKDYPEVQIMRDPEALIADSNLDLIIINTPNYTHFEYAKAALNAGKHVLIEKPFSVLKAEAEELYSLGFRKGLNVLAFQNRRFDSDFLAAKKVIESGKLGKIIEAHIRFDRFRNELSHKKFKEEPMPGAGIFYDLGAHMVDQAIALFGIPAEFEKVYGKNRDVTEVDDYAHAHLKYQQGLSVFITTNMLVLKPQAAYTIYGTKGTFTKYRTDEQENQLLAGIKPDDAVYGIEQKDCEGILTYINENGEIIEEKIPAEKGNYNLLFDNVYNAITTDTDYFVKQNDVLAQLSILEK